MALARRLADLGMLTEWRYRSLCVQLSQMGYQRAEPRGLPRESSMLLTKVFTAMREDGQRPSSIADDLGLLHKDLYSHVLGLTMLPVPHPHSGFEQTSRPAAPAVDEVDALLRPIEKPLGLIR